MTPGPNGADDRTVHDDQEPDADDAPDGLDLDDVDQITWLEQSNGDIVLYDDLNPLAWIESDTAVPESKWP